MFCFTHSATLHLKINPEHSPINCEIMISAIKSDNPIIVELHFEYFSPKSALTSALQQHLCPVHTYSLIQSATQAVTQSTSLSHCPAIPLSHCSSGSQSVSQCVMSLFCHSIRGKCQPWPVAKIGMAHICLFDIVAHSCSALLVLYIFIRFSSFTFLLAIKM